VYYKVHLFSIRINYTFGFLYSQHKLYSHQTSIIKYLVYPFLDLLKRIWISATFSIFICAKLNNKYFHGYNFLSRKHEKLSCIG